MLDRENFPISWFLDIFLSVPWDSVRILEVLWFLSLNFELIVPFSQILWLWNFIICIRLSVFQPNIIFYASRSKILRGGGYCFLSFCHSVNLSETLTYLANNVWRVKARVLILRMIILSDKIFSWLPTFFTLWPWPRSFTYSLKT